MLTAERPVTAVPKAPRTLADAGLSADLVTQLVLKTLHLSGELTGTELAKRLGLPFLAIEPVIDAIKQQHQCEVSGGLFGAPSYRYRITDAGRARAMLFMDHNHYVGHAPVPLAQYREYMQGFASTAQRRIDRASVRRAFSHLVISERVRGLDQIRLRDYEGGERRIPFGEATYTVSLGDNPEYAPEAYRLNYASMVTPPTVFDVLTICV